MRICVVYDCLFPWTVGGAERWYRNLAERLVAEGHDVTYVTLRQWDRGEPPQIPGVRIVAAGPRLELYAGPGRRKIAPPLIFGAGVLWHLLRHGRDYDVDHTASFPYFSLLAAALTRRRGRFRPVADWHEVWSRAYWEEYIGRAGGTVDWLVQKLCMRVPQRAFALAQGTAARLRAEGVRGPVEVLTAINALPAPERPEVRAPVLARPQLVPVDDEPVALRAAQQPGGQQREVRKRGGVDDVVAAPVAQQVPQHARAEDQRRRDPPPAAGVERHPRPGRPDRDAVDDRPRAAIPLAQREVRHVVTVDGQALGEVAIPALGPADRVREEAVVDDQDPHAAAGSQTGGSGRLAPQAQHSPRACVCASRARSALGGH